MDKYEEMLMTMRAALEVAGQGPTVSMSMDQWLELVQELNLTAAEIQLGSKAAESIADAMDCVKALQWHRGYIPTGV